MVQIPPVAMIAAVPMELNESGTVSFSADESSDQNGESSLIGGTLVTGVTAQE